MICDTRPVHITVCQTKHRTTKNNSLDQPDVDRRRKQYEWRQIDWVAWYAVILRYWEKFVLLRAWFTCFQKLQLRAIHSVSSKWLNVVLGWLWKSNPNLGTIHFWMCSIELRHLKYTLAYNLCALKSFLHFHKNGCNLQLYIYKTITRK